MKNFILLLMILTVLWDYGYSQKRVSKQAIGGVWLQTDDINWLNYNYYLENKICNILDTRDGKIHVDTLLTYGFYDDRYLPSIASLKNSGQFYFEVTTDDFNKEYKDEEGHYTSIITYAIDMADDSNSFAMYDIMRPGQRSTYKRIQKIPKKIEKYLKEKGIALPMGQKK